VWPCRRSGDGSWTAQYLQQVSGLLDVLVSRFAIDTNRVYVSGGSEGVHAAWDLMGARPGFFAAARLSAGWQGSAVAGALAHTPIWATCAADDGQLGSTRNLVQSLRQAGGAPVYTEYASGGHLPTIAQAWCTPAIVDWLLAQRRGQDQGYAPLLTILP